MCLPDYKLFEYKDVSFFSCVHWWNHSKAGDKIANKAHLIQVFVEL